MLVTDRQAKLQRRSQQDGLAALPCRVLLPPTGTGPTVPASPFQMGESFALPDAFALSARTSLPCPAGWAPASLPLLILEGRAKAGSPRRTQPAAPLCLCVAAGPGGITPPFGWGRRARSHAFIPVLSAESPEPALCPGPEESTAKLRAASLKMLLTHCRCPTPTRPDGKVSSKWPLQHMQNRVTLCKDASGLSFWLFYLTECLQSRK